MEAEAPTASNKENESSVNSHLQEKRFFAPVASGVALHLVILIDLPEPPRHICFVFLPDVLLVRVGPRLNDRLRNCRAAFNEAVHHSVDVSLVWYTHRRPQFTLVRGLVVVANARRDKGNERKKKREQRR